MPAPSPTAASAPAVAALRDCAVRTIDDLYSLKTRTGLDRVTLDLGQIKYRGLAHLALRLACRALHEGGELVVTDRSASGDQSISPFLIGWPSLRALAITALGRDCRMVADKTPGQMRFIRTRPVAGPGWSAGLIFSGREVELPAIRRCLDGLCAQPELLGENGEIILCGPSEVSAEVSEFLRNYPAVRYLSFDSEADGMPFPISRKKNHLLARMRFPRRLVLHARIVLEPGAIAGAPAEFDIIAPNMIWRSEKGEEPSISLITIDPGWPHLVPRRFERSMLNFRPEAYFDLFAHGRPYADGAAFAVMADVFDTCSLNDALLWGDCEDVEWCLRAQNNGYAVDMAEGMKAVNTLSKARTLEAMPRPVAHGLRAANRAKRYLTNLLRRLKQA